MGVRGRWQTFTIGLGSGTSGTVIISWPLGSGFLITDVDLKPGYSVINWPPRSGFVILNHESGSGFCCNLPHFSNFCYNLPLDGILIMVPACELVLIFSSASLHRP